MQKTQHELEQEWEAQAKIAKMRQHIKTPCSPPNIPHITSKTKKHLKLKTLFYLLSIKDGRNIFLKILKQPFLWGNAIKAILLPKKNVLNSGNKFYYGCSSTEDFINITKSSDSILVIGFSFCEKPIACPDLRFNDICRNDPVNTICNQCQISKIRYVIRNATAQILIIPTFSYIADSLIEIQKKHPKKKLCFLISACELSIQMFSDFSNILNIVGIGWKLNGRICNTMHAFELAEEGIKPGLTFLDPKTCRELMAVLYSLNH